MNNTQSFGSNSVCAQSKLNGACSSTSSFFKSASFCEDAGGRLCSEAEVLNDEVHGSGCNYDFNWMWTSTQCELSCNTDHGSGATSGYTVLLGFSGSAPEGRYVVWQNVLRILHPDKTRS